MGAIITAGVDIGSATSKVVILSEGRILSRSLLFTGGESAGAAHRAMEAALASVNGLALADIGYIVATGYGRVIVPFAQETITELSCHAKGAHWLFPSARTVLDMGGQDCKAIRCDEAGRLTNFLMNDKCAAGTGRFLELIAEVMELPLEELGRLSLEAEDEVRINSTCAVFAKSEIAALVRQGRDKRSILAGLHSAVASRAYSLLRGVGIEPDLVISGGIARNIGVVRKLEERAGLKALLPPEPQLVGALGAALFAQERLGRERSP